MHRIAGPHHDAALALDRADELRQQAFDLVGAEPRDQGQPAGIVVRVQGVDQAQQVVRLHGRADLGADRVADAAQELDMGAVELARALAAPDEMGRGVVPFAARAIDAGHGFLVAEQKRLVGGVERGGAELRRRFRGHAAGFHKGQRLRDAVRHVPVALAGRARLDEAHGPAMDPVQVGITAGRERAQQIERRGRLAIGLQQALGVRHATLRA